MCLFDAIVEGPRGMNRWFQTLLASPSFPAASIASSATHAAGISLERAEGCAVRIGGANEQFP